MRQAYSLHTFRMPSPRVLPWTTVYNALGVTSVSPLYLYYLS